MPSFLPSLPPCESASEAIICILNDQLPLLVVRAGDDPRAIWRRLHDDYGGSPCLGLSWYRTPTTLQKMRHKISINDHIESVDSNACLCRQLHQALLIQCNRLSISGSPRSTNPPLWILNRLSTRTVSNPNVPTPQMKADFQQAIQLLNIRRQSHGQKEKFKIVVDMANTDIVNTSTTNANKAGLTNTANRMTLRLSTYVTVIMNWTKFINARVEIMYIQQSTAVWTTRPCPHSVKPTDLPSIHPWQIISTLRRVLWCWCWITSVDIIDKKSLQFMLNVEDAGRVEEIC